ncbi:hypothetical protein evm_005744 [Chilo suppressalis]|nr:hypothetical protein evm_005744 [Chilo suppressalis]
MAPLKTFIFSILLLHLTGTYCKIVLPHKLRYLENMLNAEVVAKAARIRQRIEANPNIQDSEKGWPLLLAKYQADDKKNVQYNAYNNIYNRRLPKFNYVVLVLYRALDRVECAKYKDRILCMVLISEKLTDLEYGWCQMEFALALDLSDPRYLVREQCQCVRCSSDAQLTLAQSRSVASRHVYHLGNTLTVGEIPMNLPQINNMKLGINKSRDYARRLASYALEYFNSWKINMNLLQAKRVALTLCQCVLSLTPSKPSLSPQSWRSVVLTWNFYILAIGKGTESKTWKIPVAAVSLVCCFWPKNHTQPNENRVHFGTNCAATRSGRYKSYIDIETYIASISSNPISMRLKLYILAKHYIALGMRDALTVLYRI